MSISAVMNSSWSRVGDVSPTALTDARLQLHHAAQIAVSAAISYVAPRSDDSHTALTWSRSSRALTTVSITPDGDSRIALRVEDLTLHVLVGGTPTAGTFALPGRTVPAANAWLSEAVGGLGLDPALLTVRKHYTIPNHAVATGAPFSRGIASELIELSRYWSNASSVLDEKARSTPGASSVQTWPHHFDIATLITLPETGDGVRRTIGIGQSPGDDSYPEPYWYVGPYPYPETRDLPRIDGGGHWHTSGWVGAALPASDFVAAVDQRAQVIAFVDSAVAACRGLLGG